MARPIVTLTTDFGTSDAFVGAMKGVILGINPNAVIVDLTHDIPPQDVSSAAFVFATALPSFPADTIHVIVVDPGVGSGRLPIGVRGPCGLFVCPDNGLLSYVLDTSDTTLTKLPEGWSAYHLTDERYWRQPLSNTFHGRDIFAPVAGHLSLGVAPEHMGSRIDSVLTFPVPRPVKANGVLTGRVIHVDRFGSLVTNIKGDQVSMDATVSISARPIAGLSQIYQADEALLAIVGSSGYVEIAVPNGSAAMELGAGVGDEVSVRLR